MLASRKQSYEQVLRDCAKIVLAGMTFMMNNAAYAVRAHCGTDDGRGGKLAATTYFLPDRKNFKDDASFKKSVRMQGSGIDGKTIYDYKGRAKAIDCHPVFGQVTTRGAGNVCLTPYISVAADIKNKYPIGTILQVPSMQGKPIKMPNGETLIHPGYFIVEDSGGDIKGGGRIDVYSGALSPFRPENDFSRKYGFMDRTQCSRDYRVIFRKNNSGGTSTEWQQAKAAIESSVSSAGSTLASSYGSRWTKPKWSSK